eukprot:753387-Hanusia_phi.AAC.2
MSERVGPKRGFMSWSTGCKGGGAGQRGGIGHCGFWGDARMAGVTGRTKAMRGMEEEEEK